LRAWIDYADGHFGDLLRALISRQVSDCASEFAVDPVLLPASRDWTMRAANFESLDAWLINTSTREQRNA
jgi:hypothetical protein